MRCPPVRYHCDAAEMCRPCRLCWSDYTDQFCRSACYTFNWHRWKLGVAVDNTRNSTNMQLPQEEPLLDSRNTFMVATLAYSFIFLVLIGVIGIATRYIKYKVRSETATGAYQSLKPKCTGDDPSQHVHMSSTSCATPRYTLEDGSTHVVLVHDADGIRFTDSLIYSIGSSIIGTSNSGVALTDEEHVTSMQNQPIQEVPLGSMDSAEAVDFDQIDGKYFAGVSNSSSIEMDLLTDPGLFPTISTMTDMDGLHVEDDSLCSDDFAFQDKVFWSNFPEDKRAILYSIPEVTNVELLPVDQELCLSLLVITYLGENLTQAEEIINNETGLNTNQYVVRLIRPDYESDD